MPNLAMEEAVSRALRQEIVDQIGSHPVVKAQFPAVALAAAVKTSRDLARPIDQLPPYSAKTSDSTAIEFNCSATAEDGFWQIPAAVSLDPANPYNLRNSQSAGAERKPFCGFELRSSWGFIPAVELRVHGYINKDWVKSDARQVIVTSSRIVTDLDRGREE